MGFNSGFKGLIILLGISYEIILSFKTTSLCFIYNYLFWHTPFQFVLFCSFLCADITILFICALTSLFHINKPTNAHLHYSHHYEHCVTPTYFSPQRTILREYNWYIFTARSRKWLQDVKFSLLSSVYNTCCSINCSII